jgi:hypothetical protein
MAFQYTHVSKAIPAKFLTTQSAGNLLATRPQVVGPNGTEDATAKRFAFSEVSIHNRSAGDAACGIAVRLPIDLWTAGQWVDSTTTYTDDTTDAQDAANDFALGTTTNNDGFAIFCEVPFNVVSVVVGTAATDTPPIYALEYTLAGGTWGTITNAFVAPDFTATGEHLIWFAIPQDWAVSEAGHGTGVPVGQYGIRVRHTTAPAAEGGSATLLMLGNCLYPTEAIADNKVALVTMEGETPCLPQGDALVAVISVTNNQNRCDCKFRMRA